MARNTPSPAAAATPVPSTPAQAWARLRAGNARWVAGTSQHPDQSVQRRHEVASGQKPFAVVVSCIDSRVPPEIVFDEGIGELFVIRTGAQTVDGLITGSIEYGPVENATPLIVVLGHQRCGAVTAAIKSIEEKHPLPGHLEDIVESIEPAYRRAREKGDGDIVDRTVRAQTLRTVEELKDDDALEPLVRKGSLAIVGAYYSLDTGAVTTLTPTP